MESLPTPPFCSACFSPVPLLTCTLCPPVFLCSSHIRAHMTATKHFTLAVIRGGTPAEPLRCFLCKKADVRSLEVCEREGKETIVVCKKGCRVRMAGEKIPSENAKSVFDGETVHPSCLHTRLLQVLPPADMRICLDSDARPQFFTRTFLKQVDSTEKLKKDTQSVSAPKLKPAKLPADPPPLVLPPLPKTAIPQETKANPAPPAEDKKGNFSAGKLPPPPAVVPQVGPQQVEIPLAPGDEEEFQIKNVVPDVFEDEDQYLSVFMDILALEVKEERKQMEYLRTEGRVKWRKDQKVVGEIVLESVEELSHGDDLKISDMAGNSAIVTVHEVDPENNWVSFKGALDNLYIDYTSELIPSEDINDADFESPPVYLYTIEFWESGSVKRMKDGLRLFHNGRGVVHQTADWILGLEKPIVNETRQDVLVPANVHLNRYQEEAIQYALANELALIQGPPGTGKTATAAVIVYNMFIKVGEPILICAPSNIAVDQLTLNIAAFGDIHVLRIYGKNRIKQGGFLPAEEHSLHMKVRQYLKHKYPDVGDLFLNKEIPVEKIMLTWKIKEDLLALEQDIIEEHNVISCTCAMSTSKKLNSRRFKYLLIDEAGFSAEPETLLPILKGCEHIVLVGDHMQLPPVVKSRVALKCRYGRSMFERLIDIGIEAKMLQLQYRMHPALSAFPSREFYKGKLKDGIEAKDRVMEQLREFWQAHKPMEFLDVSGMEERYGKTHSYCNKAEAELIENILYELLQLEVPPTSIGIVTPYEGQRRYITEYMEETGRCDIENVEIKNIDGFQGREKDLIIISCVRSNSEAEIGFLTESRRLNVAITRAKYGLIMVGNVNVLKTEKFWRGLIDEFSRNRCVQDGDSRLNEYRRG